VIRFVPVAEMKALFIGLPEPKSGRWVSVGRLTHEDNVYRFVYTRGAKESKGFTPFGRMVDLDAAYVSDVLFPLFANRVLPKSRPEYQDYLRWLGLSEQNHDELEELARTGGLRATDALEMFPCPEPTQNNSYEVFFFSHGLRHLIPENQACVNTLKAGEKLFLARDIQNPHDANALLMRTNDPMSLVGYCPRYYSAEFTRLVDAVGADKVEVVVEQVNPDAPSQLRMLCKLTAPWPPNFSPCARDEFVPLA
jgi:hypothetical protein